MPSRRRRYGAPLIKYRRRREIPPCVTGRGGYGFVEFRDVRGTILSGRYTLPKIAKIPWYDWRIGGVGVGGARAHVTALKIPTGIMRSSDLAKHRGSDPARGFTISDIEAFIQPPAWGNLALSGISQAGKYSSHCFRRGSTQELKISGNPDATLKRAGRWRGMGFGVTLIRISRAPSKSHA